MINLPLLYCLKQVTWLHLRYIFLRDAHGSATTSLCFCNCRCSKQRHHTSLYQQVAGDKTEIRSLFLKLSCFKCSCLSNSSTSSTQTGCDALFKHFPFPVSHGRILQPIPPPSSLSSCMSVFTLRAACYSSAEKGQVSSAERIQPGQHPVPDSCLKEKTEAVEKGGRHESTDQPVTQAESMLSKSL